MSIGSRARFIVMIAMLLVAAVAPANDAPLDSGPFLQVFLRLLVFGFPLTLLQIPALVIVPAYLVRAFVSGLRKRGDAENAVRVGSSRRWSTWPIASMVPWLLLGLWMVLNWAKKHA